MRTLPSALLLLAGCGPSYFENERAASAALKTLASAQADFRGNDRDGNKIQDFWTGDVSSLYYLTPRGSDEPIKLIEQGIADADPSRPGATPYRGYWFAALEKDEEGNELRTDTKGEGTEGKLSYNHSKFGFVAYPAESKVTGLAVFYLNEGNTIFKNTTGKAPLKKFPSMDGEDDVVPGAPLPLVQKGAESVVAVLDVPHEAGKNLMWCVTLQLAWDELRKDIGASKPTLKGGPGWLPKLNAGTSGPNDLRPEWYVALAAPKRDAQRLIEEAMAAKFPGVAVPVQIAPDPDDLKRVAFAYLRRMLPFNTPFERYPEEFKFDGRSVSAFGLRPHGPRAAALSQVIVKSYASKEDFAVELKTASEHDRMLIVRLPRKATLLETVRAAVAKAGAAGQSMESQDELRVPCFNLDVKRRFSELEKPFGADSGIGNSIDEAIQVNQFRLDENGVKLISYAKFAYSVLNGDYTPPPPPPKHLVCDGPFLFLLMKTGAQLPYFALWIENAELLCPR